MAAKLLTMHVNLPDGRRLPVVIHDSELSRTVAQEVLQGISYPIVTFIDDVHTIVDVGGNQGLSGVWFSLNYPGSRIVTAEPSPVAFEVLLENAKTWPDIEPHRVGLHAQAAQVPLFHGGEDDVTGSIGLYGPNSGASTPVTIEDAEIFLQQRDVTTIDILKLDTEGCELPVLERLLPRLPGIRVIYVEYHSESDRQRIDAMLSPTHILHGGRVVVPHRGEFCYVARGAYPSPAERDLHEILMPELGPRLR